MELCTARAVLNLPRFSPFAASHARFQQFHSKSLVPNACNFNFKFSGLRDYTTLALKASSSDESSVSPYAKDGPDGVITLEDTRPVEKQEYGDNVKGGPGSVITYEDPGPVEKEEYGDKVSTTATEASSEEANLTQIYESFLGKLDLEKLDSDEKYSLLLLGAGGLAALYLISAVVGAVDSIPLVPKLMQVVGVGYTVWFTARFLVLQENRVELAAKIKDIKEQVLGSDD